MVIEYTWARSLYEYASNYLYEYFDDVPDKDYVADYYNDDCAYIMDHEIDLSDFKYLDKLKESRTDAFVIRLWDDEGYVTGCIDDCAGLLVDLFDWSIDLAVELSKGKVGYSNFLPLRGDTTWKKGGVPERVTSKVSLMCNKILYGKFVRATVNVKHFEQVPLMRIFMSSDNLTLGVWDSKYGSDNYYGEITYLECGNRTVDACLHTIVNEVQKLGVPVRDIFILTRGTCEKMYYRKNSDGEYTITIY